MRLLTILLIIAPLKATSLAHVERYNILKATLAFQLKHLKRLILKSEDPKKQLNLVLRTHSQIAFSQMELNVRNQLMTVLDLSGQIDELCEREYNGK